MSPQPQPRVSLGWQIAAFFIFALVGNSASNNTLGTILGLIAAFILGRWIYLIARYLYRATGWQPNRSPSSTDTRDGVRLGTTPQGQPVQITDRQLAAHGLILGATGSGKTTSLLTILCQQIQHDRPVIAIDLKGSRAFANQLHAATQTAGRPFQHWQPDGPCHWNPLAHGDATELKDKLISAETFTEPHYQRAAERYLQTAIQILHAASPDRPVTLAAIVGLLDPTTLKGLLPHIPQPLAQRAGPYISTLNRDQQSAVSGLQSRLAILSESQIGQYLQPGENHIDLRHTLSHGNEVVLFSLNASRYGKLAAQIAAMIIQDLITTTGNRLEQPSPPLALIAIDEFSALDTDNLLNLLARAREAGISVLLSTQELADLERLAPGFKDQVLGNTALLLAHRQNVPDSAELIAKMIGTNTTWKHTHQTEQIPNYLPTQRRPTQWRHTKLGTAREVEEFRIHPNTIKELPTGHAILLTKTPTSTATQIRIEPWSPARDAR